MIKVEEVAVIHAQKTFRINQSSDEHIDFTDGQPTGAVFTDRRSEPELRKPNSK